MSTQQPDMLCDYCKEWVCPNVYYSIDGHVCEGRQAFRDSLRNKPRRRKPWEPRVTPAEVAG